MPVGKMGDAGEIGDYVHNTQQFAGRDTGEHLRFAERNVDGTVLADGRCVAAIDR